MGGRGWDKVIAKSYSTLFRSHHPPPPNALPIPAPAPCVQPRARPLFCTVRCLRRQPSLSTVFPASLGLHHDEGEERAIATVLPTTQEHRCMRLSMSTGTPNIGPAFVPPPRTVVMAVAESWIPLATSRRF